MNYWTFGDYLAVGAGAHGKFTDSSGTIRRYVKAAHPMAFMEQAEAGVIISGSEPLSDQDKIFEYLLNALRLTGGFTESGLIERTGLPLGDVSDELGRARDDGMLLREKGGTWRPTELGTRFLNDLQARFLSLE
jgi:oxygen-independent coproporphyrinogen-3 oxidase